MDIEKIKNAIQASKVNISDHADEELENMKELIPICPNCGGEVIEKKVDMLKADAIQQ